MPWNNTNPFAYHSVGMITGAPAASGVYGIYNAQQWIYIGESQNIQARLLQHLNGDNPCIARLNPTSFMFELSPDNQRVARQNQLILEFPTACNQRLG